MSPDSTNRTSAARHAELEISPQEVARLRRAGQDLMLIDCRRPDEFEAAHIEGAMLVPLHELTLHTDGLRQHAHRPIVVYCRSGRRSMTVTTVLRELGFANVRSMSGGINRWSRDVDPSIPQY